MNEQKHTPEPWRVECDEYDDGNGGCQARAWPTVWAGGTELIGTEGFYSELGREADIANARRIVACVNACAGISTAALESLASAGNLTIKNASLAVERVNQLERQRDQLLEALKFMVERFDIDGCCYVFSQRLAISRAREAIFAVEAAR